MVLEKNFPKRKFDFILFGATGFTGKLIVEEILKTEKAGLSEPFTWALAGRSTTKLDDVLIEVSGLLGVDLQHVEKIEADIFDQNSLEEMARQCMLVLNAVGPYAKYGERVIKACIAVRTSQIDVSAETHSLVDLQLRYNKEAEKAGVYILSSCGYDSTLNESGVNYLATQFEGDLNSVESFVYTGSNLVTTQLNYGTWTSLLNFYAELKTMRSCLKQLYPNELPTPTYKVKQHGILHKNLVGEYGWCLPFPHPDVWAVERSQHYFYEKEGKRPIQYISYLKQSNILVTLIVAFGAMFLALVLKMPWGPYLLDTYPRLFSAGVITKDGVVNRKKMENFYYSMTLVGKGWNRALDKKIENNEYNEPPNKCVVLKISGLNPAYGATRTCFVQAALTFLAEKNAMPKNGGVFTPGTAFAKTSLVERLNNHGIKYEFI